jgi:hypothetical protein
MAVRLVQKAGMIFRRENADREKKDDRGGKIKSFSQSGAEYLIMEKKYTPIRK